MDDDRSKQLLAERSKQLLAERAKALHIWRRDYYYLPPASWRPIDGVGDLIPEKRCLRSRL